MRRLVRILALLTVTMLAGISNAQASILDTLLGWVSTSIETKGLAIHWGGTLTADTVELRDTEGTYAIADGVSIEWSPLKLIHGDIDVALLTARRAHILRLPQSSSGGSGSSKIAVKELRVDELDVDKAVAGAAVAVKLEGSGQRTAADQAQATLTAERIGGEGTYHLQGAMDPAGIHAKIAVDEASGGPVSTLAGLPDLGQIVIDASAQGPRNDIVTQLAVRAGRLQANAHGQVDLPASTLALTIDASAPAMAPRPDLSWQSVAVTANVHGSFSKPDATGTVSVDGLAASGAKVQRIAVDITGNQGRISARGELDGIVVPGEQPDLLAGAPMTLAVDATLDAPERPVRFTLHHPIIDASGTLKTAGTQQADIRIAIPQLGPFAAEAGTKVQGNLRLDLSATRQSGTTQASLTATLGVTGGPVPAPALIGPSAHLVMAGSLTGTSVTLTRFSFDGQDVAMTATGTIADDKIDLAWTAALARIAAIDPRLEGALRANGKIGGSKQNITLAVDLSGNVDVQGQSSGPFTAHLEAQDLPHAPTGQLNAQGSLLGSPLQFAAAGTRQPDGALQLSIREAAWKSASAQGSLMLQAGATVPVGNLHLDVQHLADFSPLLGRPITGSVNVRVDATSAQATLSATAHDAGLAGTATISDAELNASIADPTTRPVVDGTLVLTGISARGLGGSARLQANGPTDQLAVQLAAKLPNLDGASAQLATAGTVNTAAKVVTLASLTADWKQQSLRLLSPVEVGFAAGLDIHELRLGLGGALLKVNGRVGSVLDLTASAQNLPVSLIALVSPKLAVSGSVSAEARLVGTPTSPAGTIRAQASGLQLDTPTGRKMPSASITASADVKGAAAQIDARLTAGSSSVTLTGQTPFTTTAPLSLRASGSVDLALADPLLASNGTKSGGAVAGRVTLAADVTGTVSRPGGTIRLQASGLRWLTDTGRGLPPASLTARATLEGTSARIDTQLTAGTSRLAVTGRTPFSTTQPLDLRATGSLDLAIADPILTASGQRIGGTLTVVAGITGTAAAPRLTGTAQLRNGDIRDYVQGVHLADVSARMSAAGDTLRVESLTAKAGNGTLAGSGTLGLLAPGMPVNLVFTANDATPLSGGVVTATVNANMAIRGEVQGQVMLGGAIDVRQATIRIPSKLPTTVATIPVRIAGAPPAPPPKPGLSLIIAMDLTVRAPQQVFLRGRGLNSELGGTIHIQGTNQQMLPRGAFNLIRGSFNLVGSTLTFTSGNIAFNGASITDPALHLVATSFGGGTTSTLTVGGTAQNPKVTLSSVPEMPQDQILAQLLFHTNTGQLGPFQIASIAAALAELSGSTSNFPNPLVGVQNALGLDQLGIGTGPNGAPTLQAGRYIGRRLYVGAQESASGAGAQGTVQYNLTQGLKLNATVGTGETTSAIGATGQSNGASVGITYQFQY